MKKLPTWFNGTLYEEGEKVTNRFSGEEYQLTAEELSMYDFIMGAQIILEMDSGTITPQIIKDLQKGLRWFRENNSEAYMTLLD
tara:strand:- start:183 stop:434 length:252 start_codon:yes stop_codon:yes gene_type:complete